MSITDDYVGAHSTTHPSVPMQFKLRLHTGVEGQAAGLREEPAHGVRDRTLAQVDLQPAASAQLTHVEADIRWTVHLANLPENLAFFSGSIDSAGSANDTG